MSQAVEFRSVTRHFGATRAVDGVDLTIAEGAFFAMLGPSGSGKTTCLRLISGFESPSSGAIRRSPAPKTTSRLPEKFIPALGHENHEKAQKIGGGFFTTDDTD